MTTRAPMNPLFDNQCTTRTILSFEQPDYRKEIMVLHGMPAPARQNLLGLEGHARLVEAEQIQNNPETVTINGNVVRTKPLPQVPQATWAVLTLEDESEDEDAWTYTVTSKILISPEQLKINAILGRLEGLSVTLVTPGPPARSSSVVVLSLAFLEAMFSLALSAFFLNGILPLALIVMPMAFCSKKKQSQKATSTHHHRRKGDQDPGQIDHRRDTRRSKSPALPPKFDEVNFGSERGQNISIAVTHVHTNRKSRRQKKAVKSADPQPPTTSVGTSEDPYKRPPSSSSAEDEEGDEDPNSVQPVAPSSRTGGQQQQQQQQQTPQAGTPNPSHSRTSTKLKSAEMDQWMADIRADRERQKRN